MDERRRTGRFETLGAWLHIWTPARDVDVPPVPWRRLLIVGVPALAIAVAGIWLVVRDASESKREREAVEQRESDRRAATERKRLRADQAAHRAVVPPGSKAALVAELERMILADARERVRRGDLGKRVRRVACEPHPRTAPRRAAERDASRRSGRYFCLAVTQTIVGVGDGFIGYPFLARVRYGTGELAWCKTNPPPGEQAIPDPRKIVELPPACT